MAYKDHLAVAFGEKVHHSREDPFIRQYIQDLSGLGKRDFCLCAPGVSKLSFILVSGDANFPKIQYNGVGSVRISHETRVSGRNFP